MILVLDISFSHLKIILKRSIENRPIILLTSINRKTIVQKKFLKEKSRLELQSSLPQRLKSLSSHIIKVKINFKILKSSQEIGVYDF